MLRTLTRQSRSQRNLELRQLATTEKQLREGGTRLTEASTEIQRVLALPTPEEARAAEIERLKRVRKVAQKAGRGEISFSGLSKQERELAKQIKAGRSDKAILAGIKFELKKQLTSQQIKEFFTPDVQQNFLLQFKSGAALTGTPISEFIPEKRRTVTVRDVPPTTIGGITRRQTFEPVPGRGGITGIVRPDDLDTRFREEAQRIVRPATLAAPVVTRPGIVDRPQFLPRARTTIGGSPSLLSLTEARLGATGVGIPGLPGRARLTTATPTTPTLLQEPVRRQIPTQISPASIARARQKAKFGFNVFANQKGKFIKLNTRPLTKPLARDLGAFVTDKTNATKFRLRRTNRFPKKPLRKIPENYFSKNSSKFKQTSDRRFSERKPFRNDSKAERKTSIKSFFKRRGKK